MLHRKSPPFVEGAVLPVEGVEGRVVQVEVKVVEVVLRSLLGRNTQTCRQGSGLGALCTENGGGGHIFVPNPPPAPGRMFSLPNLQINETGTSPEV